MGLFFGKKKDSSNTDEFQDLSSKHTSTGKAIAFLNQKGGVGKTTMAFNTACALADKGHKVLCLDMDPQANLSLLCGYEQESEINLYHLLINTIRELRPLHTGAMLHDVLVSGDKVDLLPSGPELSGFELSVAGVSVPRQLILKKFIEKNRLLELYDYVVIDGPPTLGLLVVNIMCAVSGILVPFRPDEFSRKGLVHFYDALENIEEMGVVKTPQVIAHIPNLVDTRRKQESDDLERIKSELSEEFGEDTVVEPFYNRAPLVRSQAERKSVYEFSSKEFTTLRDQFDRIALKIENQLNPDQKFANMNQ